MALAGQAAGHASIAVPVTVRTLGDVNGDTVVDTSDKVEMDRFLNGIVTPMTLRELDLTGNGVIDTEDKLVVNRLLNGIVIP